MVDTEIYSVDLNARGNAWYKSVLKMARLN